MLLLHQDEHHAVREGKAAEQALDWDDYKSMRFTRGVSQLVVHFYNMHELCRQYNVVFDCIGCS